MSRRNEHIARINNQSLFIKETMRSKKETDGLRIITGKLKETPNVMAIQSYRFKKDTYSIDDSENYLKDNDIEYTTIKEAKTIDNSERAIALQCLSLGLTEQEIRNHVPINVMADLKNKDSNPHLRAYSIVQEGIATPNVIGESNALPTKWSTKVVQSLKGIVKKGVQFFVGHNADNSTNGRRSVGEVVANFQKNISGKLHDIVIGYFPDKIEADNFDVCSIEGSILAQDYDDYSIVKQVKNITGIALGNSAYDKPAFPGAVYMGSIQAFGDNEENTPPPKTKTIQREEITMTFDEIKKAVKDMNIFPAQLYTEDDIKNDRNFLSLIDKASEDAKKLTTDDFMKQLEGKDETINKLNKEMTLVTAQDKLTKSLPEGLTDLQKTFIEKKFKPENMEELEENNIKDFVDNSLKEYSEYASLFGAEKTETPPDNPSDNSEETDEIDKIVNEVITQPKGE